MIFRTLTKRISLRACNFKNKQQVIKPDAIVTLNWTTDVRVWLLASSAKKRIFATGVRSYITENNFPASRD